MEIGVSEQSLPESSVFRVRVTEDFELDCGAWKHTGEQKGWLIARITPPTMPMFQQVVEYLEAKPVPPGGTTKRADEARATVAVCLRWGSYFAVLADPSRPDAPDIADEEGMQAIADALLKAVTSQATEGQRNGGRQGAGYKRINERENH